MNLTLRVSILGKGNKVYPSLLPLTKTPGWGAMSNASTLKPPKNLIFKQLKKNCDFQSF